MGVDEKITLLETQLKTVLGRVEAIEQNNKSMLLIGDVAKMTGMSKSHIYKLTCTKQIPHYKPNGKHLYFDKAEIEDWMKRGKAETNDEAAQMAAKYIVRKAMGV